jgi:putative ABC transport system ATP-binding protein
MRHFATDDNAYTIKKHEVTTMLRLTNLTKTFANADMQTYALDNVDLAVEPGEFLSIMGPSGCGKSTLLNILGLLDRPDDGQYFFKADDIARYREADLAKIRGANIGFIFQSFNLIDELTVFENVELPLIYRKVPAAVRREKVEAMLEKVGVSSRRDHMPQQLSGGQQQRVAIARALIGNPALLLADEPTGNLDSRNGEEILGLLRSLNEEGATIVMVTHSQRDAEYSHRVIHMKDGRISNETRHAQVRYEQYAEAV